jgi:glucose/arabinose dehydrogenase
MLAGCNTSTTPAPPVVQPSNETINGTERIGWSQPAADAVELTRIRYAVYVDGTRSELAGVTCSDSITPTGFACSAKLPAMASGAHTLQLASFMADAGPTLESARSGSLNVTVVAATTANEPATSSNRRESTWASGPAGTTIGRVALQVERIADDVDQPADLAVAPDGRLFVAERSGRIRILRDGRLLSAAAWSLAETPAGHGQILALALDPQFDRTRFVFAVYTTTSSRSGEPMFSLVRFRETSDTLADRIVLLDEVRASQGNAMASLRFGPDGKLYAAFDDGGDPRLPGDLASLNGKALRLNPDGSTPRDQAGSTPLYSYPYRSPSGLDWDPVSGALWVADRKTADSARLSAVVPDKASPGATRGVVSGTYALPHATIPSSIAFYRGRKFPAFAGSLLVASDEGRHLLRIAVGNRSPSAPAVTEQLLQDRVGGVRAVAVGADGTIYFATAHVIGRLVPNSSP